MWIAALAAIGLAASWVGAPVRAHAWDWNPFAFKDDSPEMKKFSAVPDCSKYEDAQSARFCAEQVNRLLGDPVAAQILGPQNKEVVETTLDVTEKVFTDLLKARTLQFQVAHMAFRDGIDLSNSGDAWDTAEKVMAGKLGPSLLGVDPDCTGQFPEAKKIHEAGTREFFRTGKESAERSARLFKKFDDFVMGGGAQTGDPRCAAGMAASLACLSLPERAYRARLLSDKLFELRQNKGPAEEIGRNEAALSAILASDPALNETIDGRPAYDVIGGDQKMVVDFKIADHKFLDDDMRASYQKANHQFKQKILDSIQLTCKSDGSDMVLSPQIADSLLEENPGFKGVYCRLLKKKLKSKKVGEYENTALLVAGWGATAASFAASFFTGGAATPLALSLAGSAAFATRYKKGELEAHEALEQSTQLTGAGVADPREIGAAASAEKKFKEEFKGEMKAVVLSIGLEAAVQSYKAWRAAGKISALEEAALIRRSEQIAEEGGAAAAGAGGAAKPVFDPSKAWKPVGAAYTTDLVKSGEGAGKMLLKDKIMESAQRNYWKLAGDEVKTLKFVEGEEAVKLLTERAQKTGHGAWAYYDSVTNTIVIHPNATIETLMHEIRHAQQYISSGKAGLPKLLKEMNYVAYEKLPGGKSLNIKSNLLELDVDLWQMQAYRAKGNAKAASIIKARMAKRYIEMRSVLDDLNAYRKTLSSGSPALARVSKEIEAFNLLIGKAARRANKDAELLGIIAKLRKNAANEAAAAKAAAEKAAEAEIAALNAQGVAGVDEIPTVPSVPTAAGAETPSLGFSDKEIDALLANVGD